MVGRAGGAASGESEDDRSSTPSGGRHDKWKVGAKKALLQWCRAQVTDKFGIEVRDFGRSWRDGNAFLGIVNSIKPGRKLQKNHLVAVLLYAGLNLLCIV